MITPSYCNEPSDRIHTHIKKKKKITRHNETVYASEASPGIFEDLTIL